MPNAQILFNPTAGRFASDATIERAARHLETAGWEIEIILTKSPAHVTELARQAAADGLDAVFIAGGDGSIRETVVGLAGSQTAMGVLPAGTANVWARELGLESLTWTNRRALENSAQALSQAAIREMDVGFINGEAFLLWAGIGFDGNVVGEIEIRRKGRRRFATQRYMLALLNRLRTYPGIELRITTDKEQIEGKYLLAVISNIRTYAGGWSVISPQACLDDGQMDLWLFDAVDFWGGLRYVQKLIKGNHHNAPGVTQVPIRSLKIEAEVEVQAQLDGDPFAWQSPVHVEVRRRALRILAPPQTPAGLFGKP